MPTFAELKEMVNQKKKKPESKPEIIEAEIEKETFDPDDYLPYEGRYFIIDSTKVPAKYAGYHPKKNQFMFKKDASSRFNYTDEFPLEKEVDAPKESTDDTAGEQTVEAEVEVTKATEKDEVTTQELAVVGSSDAGSPDFGDYEAGDLMEALSEGDSDIAAIFQEQSHEELYNTGQLFPRLKLGKSGYFEGPDGWTPVKEIEAYILFQNQTQVMFEGDKARKGANRLCWSDDGKRPYGGERYAQSCSSCLNYGKNGKCQTRQRLVAYLPKHGAIPFELSLSYSSTFPVQTVINMLRQKRTPYCLQKFRMAGKAIEINGNDVVVLSLTPIRPDLEELTTVRDLLKKYYSSMKPGEPPAVTSGVGAVGTGDPTTTISSEEMQQRLRDV